MKKENNTLPEMLVGILVWGILVQIVLLLAFRNYLYNAVGLWCGIALSAGLAVHMKISIEDALDLGAANAKRQFQVSTVKRLVMAVVVIGIVFYFRMGNPLTLLVGIFSLKISAYSQPLMHKIFQKFQKSE